MILSPNRAHYGDHVRRAEGLAMLEILFIYQLAHNPLQAVARRWWCRNLFRATRGRRGCPESTDS
jgi:hypothetical protein